MEVPRLGVKLEQYRILNPLSKARDRTCILMDKSQIHYCWATTGTPHIYFLCESQNSPWAKAVYLLQAVWENVSLPFPASRGHLCSLAWSPFLHFQSQQSLMSASVVISFSHNENFQKNLLEYSWLSLGINFRCTAKWISYIYTYIHYFFPSRLLQTIE